MDNLIFRRKIAEGAHFNSVSDPRYKFNRITVGFFTPLDEEKASLCAVIPRILCDGNKNYPVAKDFNNFLASLYNAKIDNEVESFGDTQFIGLSINFMDDAFALNGENITDIAVNTLFDCLFSPVTENKGFAAQTTENCKRLQTEAVEAEINDKRQYAANQAKRTLYAGEPAAVNHQGDVERINKATPQSLLEAYHELLRTSVIEIVCVGCNNFSGAFEIAKKEFAKLERGSLAPCSSEYSPLKPETAEITERLPLNQSKMVLGFKNKQAARADASAEKAALTLMSNLYGGTISSKLFLNVREKLSLCYYCWSRLNKYKGAMYVSCGVEEEKIGEAKAEILLQLENVRKGDFTDEEMNNALLSELNNIKTVNDSLSSLTWWYITRIYAGEIKSPEQFLQNYENITREDIINAANAMQLDTFYVLSKEAGENEDE